MIFQSRYRNFSVVVRSATYETIPGMQRSRLVPQLVARFLGPQRLFDSKKVAREENWSEEEEAEVVDWLFNHPTYMVDIFVAPGEDIPEEYQELSARKSPPKAYICEKFEIVDNDIIRCPEPVTAGSKFCKLHDGSEQQRLVGQAGSGNVGLTTTTG